MLFDKTTKFIIAPAELLIICTPSPTGKSLKSFLAVNC